MSTIYRLVLLLSFLIPSSFFSQLSDNFSDGDYTNNPTWAGDINKYEVNVSNQLQSNGPTISDTAYLSANTGNLDFNTTIVWEFYVEVLGLDINKMYASVFKGDYDAPRDEESTQILKGI